LTSLRQQAEARIAPIRNAMIAAAIVAAKAAEEIQQRRKAQYRVAQYAERLDRLGPPTTSPEQMIGWQAPDSDLELTNQLGRIYSLPELTGEVPTPPETETSTPQPDQPGAVETQTPPGDQDQPVPQRIPIAPYEPGYLPYDPDLHPLEGKWIARGARLLNSGARAFPASAIQYTALEAGRLSVSAPSLARGTRADFLSKYGLRGGPYTRTGLGQVGLRQLSLRNLARGARGTIGVGLVTSLAGNLYDYTIGTRRSEGLGREFAVSTGVDLLLTVGSGLAAAGTVAFGAAALAAAFAITAPVWATIAATAIAGLGIGILLDATGVGAGLKRSVNAGFDALPGILSNGKIIAQVVGERAGELVSNVARSVVDTAVSVADTVGSAALGVAQTVGGGARRATEAARATLGGTIAAIQESASTVVRGAQEVTSNIVEGANQVIDSARRFLGNLFGSGD
jgi:hypothetical protein